MSSNEQETLVQQLSGLPDQFVHPVYIANNCISCFFTESVNSMLVYSNKMECINTKFIEFICNEAFLTGPQYSIQSYKVTRLSGCKLNKNDLCVKYN